MKRKLTLLAAMLFSALFMYAQIQVSTGLNATLTGPEPIGNIDPYWKIASSPNPPNTPARVSTFYSGYWQPTPVGGTNAGWINYSANAYGGNPPGIYVFERDFTIPVSTASFSCNFGVAYDDALVSLELVSPSAATTALAVTPTTAYYLSVPITNTITAPAAGTWKIRATVNFIDQAAAFMLSGTISTVPCRGSFVIGLDNWGGSEPGIFENPAGGFFATGLLKDSTVIVKSDNSGNILWVQKFKLGTGFYQIKDLKVDSNTGDLLGIANKQNGGYQSMIFRCNATATTFGFTKDNKSIVYSQLHLLNAADFIVTGSNNGGFTHLERRSIITGNITTYNLQGEGGDYYSTLVNGRLYGTCRRYYNAAGDFRTGLFAHDAASGSFLWQNAIISRGNTSITTQTRMYPVAPVVDNGRLVVLSSGDLVGFDAYNSGPVEMVMAQTDLVGNVAWTQEYITAGYDRPVSQVVKNTSTGYYIVATLYSTTLSNFAYTLVIKTDKAGNVVWARRLGLTGRNIATKAVERNGSLYLSLASDSYLPNQLMLVKLDPAGNSSQRCEYIQPVNVTARLLPNVQDLRNYPITAKVLAQVNLATIPGALLPQPRPYCFTDCKDSATQRVKGAAPVAANSSLPARAQGMAVSPNPAHNMVTVMLPKALAGKAALVITDLAGRTVQQVVLPAGVPRLDVQLSNMPAGTYQLTVYAAGTRVASAKLVKQ